MPALVLLQMSVRKRYEAMRDALNATGKPILFSMCEWGVSSPWEYGHEVCLHLHFSDVYGPYLSC